MILELIYQDYRPTPEYKLQLICYWFYNLQHTIMYKLKNIYTWQNTETVEAGGTLSYIFCDTLNNIYFKSYTQKVRKIFLEDSLGKKMNKMVVITVNTG